MKVLVAGASGVIGRQLVPRLLAAGHEVAGITRGGRGVGVVEGMGARVLVADALDGAAIERAVHEAEPDAVVHELTAIAGFDPRRLDRDFALTNRLRTEGTDHLLAAARAVGVARFVAQSFAGLAYGRNGAQVEQEEDLLETEPPRNMRRTHAAIRHVERAVSDADWTQGLILRYGWLYGPGTSLQLHPPAGEQIEATRARKLPLIGDATGVWSFVHVADAADATVCALERGEPGVYNIVDDDPTAVAEWVPALARALGVKPPRRLPAWLARLIAGEETVALMSRLRGASNAKAKRELGWQPQHPSFRRELDAAA